MSRILRKEAAERSAEEGRLLAESEDLVTELQGRSRRREGLKRRQEEASPAAPRPPPPPARLLGGWMGRRAAGRADRRPGSRQVCDDPEELRRKVRELAGAVRGAKHLVVYTGAGISTVGARRTPRTWRAPAHLAGPGPREACAAGTGGPGRPLLGV